MPDEPRKVTPWASTEVEEVTSSRVLLSLVLHTASEPSKFIDTGHEKLECVHVSVVTALLMSFFMAIAFTVVVTPMLNGSE